MVDIQTIREGDTYRVNRFNNSKEIYITIDRVSGNNFSWSYKDGSSGSAKLIPLDMNGDGKRNWILIKRRGQRRSQLREIIKKWLE